MAMNAIDVKKAIKESDHLENCVCVLYDNQICKFKITFEDVDVDNLIEDYLNSRDIYLFEATDEDSLEDKSVATKFFPYLGKFRLEGRFKSTDNYFAPISQGGMLKILFSMYRSNILKENNLDEFEKLYSVAESDNILNFINQIFSNANIELFNAYTLEELETSIDLLEKVSSSSRFFHAYLALKKLLESSKANRERIDKLGLNDYFVEAIEKKKEDSVELIKKHN